MPGSGTFLAAGENIYGPFEAGFSSRQDGILAPLGCAAGAVNVPGGVDTLNAEQMVASMCGVVLPRYEGDEYLSLLDLCGGHTRDYHFHEKLTCLYANEGSHSAKIGEMMDGKFLYGQWEDYSLSLLPQLDACGGHWGVTPESAPLEVYWPRSSNRKFPR